MSIIRNTIPIPKSTRSSLVKVLSKVHTSRSANREEQVNSKQLQEDTFPPNVATQAAQNLKAIADQTTKSFHRVASMTLEESYIVSATALEGVHNILIELTRDAERYGPASEAVSKTQIVAKKIAKNSQHVIKQVIESGYTVGTQAVEETYNIMETARKAITNTGECIQAYRENAGSGAKPDQRLDAVDGELKNERHFAEEEVAAIQQAATSTVQNIVNFSIETLKNAQIVADDLMNVMYPKKKK